MSAIKPTVLEAAVPILSVTDLTKALHYYQTVLGFQVAWCWGEPARLASVCRDRVEVNLWQSSEAQFAGSKVYFRMAGVAGYYNDVTIAGARVAIALADRPYGLTDFRIVDPYGNELSFGEPTATSPGVS